MKFPAHMTLELEGEPLKVVSVREADYIIVGAGSAGCILAERLSSDPETTVILLEAGGADRSPWISLPLGYGKLFGNPDLTWQYRAEPDSGLNGRTMHWPRGRVVGGSGSVNAMVYCRGLPQDFEDWEASGARGWGWSTVRRTFEQLETKVSALGQTTGSGPIHVQDTANQIHPFNRHFFAAVKEAGLGWSDDMNGDAPEGAGIYNINTRKGLRCSSARAFLKPALSRKNLVLRKKAQVSRLLFDGQAARGVELVNGEQLSAHREVILCAGAIGSPQLLQVSGIGPGDLLQDLRIPVLHHNANVGGNLQDHLGVNYTFKAREATLNPALRSWVGQGRAAIQYALMRKGPLALSVNQCGGFVRSCKTLNRPDQQLYLNPMSYQIQEKDGRRFASVDPFNGFIVCAQPARPTSRGRIDIQSADSTLPPRIQPNSLTTEEDRRAVVAGGRLCQKIIATSALRTVVEAPVAPYLTDLDEDGLLADFRARASTVYHPVSTCMMGEDRDAAVVDSRLKVHGVERLRVVDASAFPNITSGNTNAPTMMLALRSAELILEDQQRHTQ